MNNYYGFDEVFEVEEENEVEFQEKEHNCSGCMHCLGLSWSDFY